MQHERGDMGIAKADAGAATYLDDDQVLVQRPPGLVVRVVLHQALKHPLQLRDQRHTVLLWHLKVSNRKAVRQMLDCRWLGGFGGSWIISGQGS